MISHLVWRIVNVKLSLIDFKDMYIRFRTEPDNIEYEVEPKKGLLMMCDILGFSNLVMSSECIDLSEKIVNIIDTLKIGTEIECTKILTGNPELLDKLPNWSNEYKLKYFLLSDTILIYPSVDYEKLQMNIIYR